MVSVCTVGNNPATICGNCPEGSGDAFCTVNDPFAGYHGAFECMHSGAGDVAFIRDLSLAQATSNSSSGRTPEVGSAVPSYARYTPTD